MRRCLTLALALLLAAAPALANVPIPPSGDARVSACFIIGKGGGETTVPAEGPADLAIAIAIDTSDGFQCLAVQIEANKASICYRFNDGVWRQVPISAADVVLISLYDPAETLYLTTDTSVAGTTDSPSQQVAAAFALGAVGVPAI